MIRFTGRAASFQTSVKVAAFSLLVSVSSALPGVSYAQSFTINAVNIAGNQRVEDGTILTFAGISRGETLSADELNAAVQNIRNSGLFSAVDIVPSGNTLNINVVEFPTIFRVNVEGNSDVRDAELLAAVQSQPRRVYSPAQAERDVAAITEVYAAQGRINATVTPRIIERSDNRVDLIFEVNEAGVTEIERISFVGNRTYSESRLRRVLQTKQAGILRAIIRADTFVADRIAFDQRALTDFYNARGFADFEVKNVDVALTQERDAYLITFNVQEGQQFTFGDISLSSTVPGVDAAAFREVLRTKTGATYSPTTVDVDIARLERLAIQRGIPFVAVEPRITRDARNLRLNVEFALVPGDRIFVERIDIEGNNTTLDRVVRNQFRIVEGDPFNPREIRQSAERIRALGFFADAQVQARDGTRSDQVIIDVDVVEQPTGSLSFGANFDTENSVSLVASYRERNFLGRGQSLAFQLSTAESNRRISFDFTEPQFLDRDLRAGFSLAYRTTDNQNALYDTETFRFSPNMNFPVSENGRLTLFYAAEFTDLTDVQDDSSQIIVNEAAAGLIWGQSLGYTYSYDTRRTGLDPNAGVLLRFGQEFGVGDSNFIKTTALASAEAKVLNEEVTLRATIEGGHLNYQDNDSRVTDRFFLGSRVMRGFEAGGIGPRDALTDDALGGNTYAAARLEAEFPLGLPEEYGLSGGVFVDYGSVWDVGNTFGQDVLYNDFTPRSVAGVALFWDTPVGPLRFNFTETLDAQSQDRDKAFDITISTQF